MGSLSNQQPKADVSHLLICSQDVTLQHYMDYTAESLIPVMAHIAKNVVKVNNGQTKHMVGVTFRAPSAWIQCLCCSLRALINIWLLSLTDL